MGQVVSKHGIIQRQLGDLCLDQNVDIRNMAAVTPDTLLISNEGKKRVQLLDSRTGWLLCEVQLQNIPGIMCLTDRNTAAVCVGLDKIQMIQVEYKTLILGRVVAVGKNVSGITSSNNTLVVSYWMKPWLEKVSMDGKVHKQFDNEGYPEHFTSPMFMCSRPDGSVFISDTMTKKVTQVDVSLNLLQTFTSSLLEMPRGIIAVTGDQILVCNWNNHRIVLLQPSTKTMSTLLGKKDKIFYPWSLAYCPYGKKLFVASNTSTKIKVYQIA